MAKLFDNPKPTDRYVPRRDDLSRTGLEPSLQPRPPCEFKAISSAISFNDKASVDPVARFCQNESFVAERKISYERLSVQRDVELVLSAPSYERLFIDAALAATDFRFPLDLIQISEQKRVELSASGISELMGVWIGAVFALSQKEKFLARRIVFEKFDGKTLKASLHGEKHDPIRHGGIDTMAAFVEGSVQLQEAKLPDTGFIARIRFQPR